MLKKPLKFRFRLWAGVLLVAIFVLALSLHGKMLEVDINTGRVRNRNAILDWTLHENVQDTDFSRFVKQYVNNEEAAPEWRIDLCRRSMSNARIHYPWGGSTNKLRYIGNILVKGDLRLEDKIELAKRTLDELKKGGYFVIQFNGKANRVSLIGDEGKEVWAHDLSNIGDVLIAK